MTDQYFESLLEEPDLKYVDHIRTLAYLVLSNRRDKHTCEAHLMARYLYDLIGRRQWNTVRDICDFHDLITTNGSYVVGKHSMCYRLADDHVGKSRPYEITDRDLASRIRAWWDDKDEDFWAKVRKHHRGCVRTFNTMTDHREKLTLERVDVAAMCFESDQIVEDWKKYRYEVEVGGRETDFDIDKMATSREHAAQLVWNRDWHDTMCNHGRWHWALTCLWKRLRPHLRYDGQRLVSIDVKSSQPVFFCMLMLKEMVKDRGVYRDILHDPNFSSLSSIMIDTSVDPFSQHPYLSRTYADVIPSISVDVQCFLTNTLDHDHYIYDTLAKLAGCEHEDKATRKGNTFHILYGRNNQPTPYQTALNRHFPHVSQFIKAYKEIEGPRAKVKEKDKHKDKSHSILAQDMQAAESNWMFDGVCKRLTREHPHIPIFSIHDALLTTPEHVTTVSDVMYQEMFKLGIRARFEITRY